MVEGAGPGDRADAPAARVVCLGNDLLADDAFGCRIVDRLRRAVPPDVEVTFTAESGLDLLEYLTDAPLVVVVDTVQTGSAPPGTVHVLEADDLEVVPGPSPHYVGLFEALALGRALSLPVTTRLIVVAVEAFDCRTVGGEMHPAVADAVPVVLACVAEQLDPVGAADRG